jgi:maleate cis-trans isomerase
MPRPRFDHRAGFIAAPGGFDCSPQEFLRVAPRKTGVIQRVLAIENYDQSLPLAGRAKNFGLIEEAALALGLSQCHAVGQVGSNWVHCTGTTPDQIGDICKSISDRIGGDFHMAGYSLVLALREIGAKRITVTNGYYRPDWAAGINRFLEQAGFEILYSGNMVDQGIYESVDAMAQSEVLTGWDYPISDCARTLMAAHDAARDADCIVLTGAGTRTLDCIEAIEAISGKTAVASDCALYWSMLKSMNLSAAGRGFGNLLSSL